MKTNNKRLILGAIFVLVGVTLILRNLGFFDFEIPFHLVSWQVVFIGVGAIIIFSTGKVLPGTIFIAIGFLNWFPELWPLILIGIGIGVIYKKSDSKKNFDKSKISINKLDDVAVFGGGNKIIESDNFEGGETVAVFGGSEIDLSTCKLAEGIQEIEIVAIFGGTSFIVPKDWNVQIDVLSIFGGFSDKRFKNPEAVRDNTRSLRIKGIVIFGGGELK